MAPGTAPGKPPAGPGGCDSPTACMKFCSESDNQETCMNFAPSRADQAPGDLQVPRIEPGQDRPQQSGSPDDRREGESGQQRPGSQNAPGEQRERMEPGQPEFGAPPPQGAGQEPGQFNQIREENRLNQEMPLREAQPLQQPTGEAGQQSGEAPPPAPASVPAEAQPVAPAPEVQAPAPASEPAPQTSSGGGLISSIANFFALLFSK